MPLSIDLVGDCVDRLKRQRELRDLVDFAGAALSELGGGEWSLTLLLAANPEIEDLHGRYFGDRSPTDVMSFPSGEDLSAAGSGYLGDIAISVDVAAEQAQGHSHSLDREIAFLTLHGLLHLLGYEDDTSEARQVMLDRQSDILEAFERTTGRRVS